MQFPKCLFASIVFVTSIQLTAIIVSGTTPALAEAIKPPAEEAVSKDADGQFVWGLPKSFESVGTTVFYFRKAIELNGDENVVIDITCDDGYRLYFNGRLIGSDKNWQSVERYDVTANAVKGRNVVAVQAENGSVGPAGLYVKVESQSGETKSTFCTDKSWKFNTIPMPGWRFSSFDDKTWKPAFEQVKFRGGGPWGDRFVFAKTIEVVPKAVSRSKRDGFELLDGDRVVFLGDTFIERMQTNDYIETMITSQFPNRKIVFRNLGWSGDNVFGTSRAVFGSVADGFRRLENDVKLTRPTLIVLSYGRNESFNGKDYLPTFLNGLETLVEVLSTTGAEIAFLSPTLMENLGPPLPSPEKQNELISYYSDAIRGYAENSGRHFIDNLKPLGTATVSKTSVPAIRDRLTDNGIHFTDYGYWRTAFNFAKKFGGSPARCEFSFDLADQTYSTIGSTVQSVSSNETSLRFNSLDDRIPFSPAPKDTPRGGRMMAIHDLVKVTGLAPGKYGLKINGKPTVMAPAEQWNAGLFINRGNYLPQVEELRSKIKRKNEMFFHRYRPQNETYLFLFRKHEQGNNAVEIPKFDPIVEKLEQEIDALKKPKVVKYLLEKISDPSELTDQK